MHSIAVYNEIALIQILHTIPSEYMCYDDGCHLRKFARNPVRSQVSAESKLISQLEIVVDKMHMRSHTDSWCKQNCDPLKHPYLKDVGLFTSYFLQFKSITVLSLCIH